MRGMETHESITDAPIVDLPRFGRLLRAARIVAGYDRVTDAAQHVRAVTGLRISDRVLYSLERGEQSPSLEQTLAFVMAYRPLGGGAFFAQAVRPDVMTALIDARGETDGTPRGQVGNA